MDAAQMGTEQGGASAWRAVSNLCRHPAIEANGGNRVPSGWSTAESELDCGGLGSVSPESKGSCAQVLSEDVKCVMYVYYVNGP